MGSKRIIVVMSVATVLIMVLAAFAAVPGVAASSSEMRVIVTFKDEVNTDLIKTKGGEVDHTFKHVPAVQARMTPKVMKELEKSTTVLSVVEDGKASILAKPETPPGQDKKPPKDEDPEQELPWGVEWINADHAWDDSTGSGVNVAVLDTGIDTDHSDLNVAGGVNFIPKGRKINPSSYDDDNGHGTHCAGIIGAINNDIGVVGVAPAVNLYAVKIANRQGSLWWSDAAKGVEWCIKTHEDSDDTNDIQVISMSFGGYDTTGIGTFQQMCSLAQSTYGIVLVAAAGNSNLASKPVMYPAVFGSVIAVSAMDDDYTIASYSCYGDEVELTAPGTNIYSTYKGGGYYTMSGTSMACPHVAGVAALLVAQTIPSSLDGGNDMWDNDEVRDQINATVIWKTAWGTDPNDYYGNGLVDAQAAANLPDS